MLGMLKRTLKLCTIFCLEQFEHTVLKVQLLSKKAWVQIHMWNKSKNHYKDFLDRIWAFRIVCWVFDLIWNHRIPHWGKNTHFIQKFAVFLVFFLQKFTFFLHNSHLFKYQIQVNLWTKSVILPQCEVYARAPRDSTKWKTESQLSYGRIQGWSKQLISF